MNKQIERILICLLWLLAATLGTSFWLNTMFGFNIFSAQHWQYLAYMQASQIPVRSAFYISLICSVLVTFVVLYILIRPNGVFRRHKNISYAKRAQQLPQQQTASPSDTITASVAETISQPSITVTGPSRPRGPASMLRTAAPTPKPQANNTAVNPAPAFTPTSSANTVDFGALKQIFEDTGYTVKHSPQIGNFRPALLAIGLDEMLWIGGVGITQEALLPAIERLSSVFSDTLDDIEININGFIISPSAPISNDTILSFENIDALREYMYAHPNPEIGDNDSRENFNAYSEYIDTVINYMDKT